MTRIKQTEVLPPGYIVAAKCHYQAQGCSRVRVARMYMVSDNREGVGCKEYLLTRYVTKLGVAMSSILGVEKPHPSSPDGESTFPKGEGKKLREVCREGRKQEEKMIMAWYTREGAMAWPESLT